VKVAEDSIVLEAVENAPLDVSSDGQSGESENGPGLRQATTVPVATAVEPAVEPASEAKEAPVPESDREQGRVKWFDPEKGYGFLVRPTGDDLFVHHSEVEGDPSDLEPGGEVEYVVGRNDRGPNARSVRLVGE